jgi:hypothetical protein
MANADKEKLEKLVTRSITKVFKDALAYAEMAGVDEKQFKRIRKQILRSGNDEIRKVSEELEKFEVTYHPSYDDEVIKFEGE